MLKMGSRLQLSKLLEDIVLVEKECWAVLHLVSEEILRNIDIYLESGVHILQLPEYVQVTRSNILLHPTGDISLDGLNKGEISRIGDLSLLPPTCNIRLENMIGEDWQRVGLYSLARTMISSIPGENLSTEIMMFFKSILNQTFSYIPKLSDVIIYLERKVGAEDAVRLVSSLYSRYQSIQEQSKDQQYIFTQSESALNPLHQDGNHHLVSGDKGRSELGRFVRADIGLQRRIGQSMLNEQGRIGGSVSCPSLVPKLSDPCFSSLENLMNNNDVFALLDLPGLKFKGRRTNLELSSTCKPEPKPEPYIPGFVLRRSRSALQYSLAESSRAGQIVRILLLTGHKIEMRVEKMKTKTKDVLQVCLDRMKVKDEMRSMFGLFSCLDEEYLYLDQDSLLASHLHNGVLTLYLRYISTPEYDELCPPLQHLMYLQLRQDLISGNLDLDPLLQVELGVLAVQAEVPENTKVRLDPQYFLCKNLDPEIRLRFTEQAGVHLTSCAQDAQALYCGLVINSDMYSMYRYWGRENRGEGSRKISLWIVKDKLMIAGRSFSYSDIRQLSYTQSYLQILVKHGDQPTRFKIFFPDNKSRYIHDLLVELQTRYIRPTQPKVISRTRRSLGAVCNQIVGAAKEVGRSIRTPKRSRSMSAEHKIGGKRRKLSLGSVSSSRKENKENSVQEKKVEDTPRSTGVRNQPDHGYINKTGVNENFKMRTGMTESPRMRIGITQGTRVRTKTDENSRMRVRMGTRMMGEGVKSGGGGEEGCKSGGGGGCRRILQVMVGLDELEKGEYSVSGHGILVTRTGTAQLLPGDRIIALDQVSLEQVSIQNFKSMISNLENDAQLIISRCS